MMKKYEGRSTVYLPDDLLVEILSRVPAKSLARLRSTSKRWNALVKDSILAKKHSANAPKDSSMVLMVAGFRVYKVSLDLHGNVTPSAQVPCQISLKDHLSEQVDVHNAFHCDGLLVCVTKDRRLVVWNPCSGETRWIQARNKYNKNDYYALGYSNKSSGYKILMMHRSARFVMRTTFKVYDFASNTWRGVGSTTEWFIPESKIRGMSVKGTAYWLALKNPSDIICFLLSFDYSTEKFQSHSLPPDAPQYYFQIALSVTREEQQLCMITTNFPSDKVLNTDVWIATKIESTGAMSWSKSRRFHLWIWMSVLRYQKIKPSLCCNYKCKCNPGLGNILYIVGEDKYILEDYCGNFSTVPLLLTYVPSLAQRI